MNLTSLFNFSYLKENIKKSRAIILLCMLLLPVLNGIILLMKASSGDNFVSSFYDIACFVLFGMYFIPVIISITLFGFVYKKGSIDFTLSMPINKKQIFLTNTVGGTLIILIMHVINFIIMLLVSLIYSNIIISYKMLFDILFIGFISYVFVFVCTNIAVSVSSNKITTVIVTLLILFLIPFISTFINTDGFSYDLSGDVRVVCANNDCKPNMYYCDTAKCEINRKNNTYNASINKVDGVTYTMPYEIVKNVLLGYGVDSNIGFSTIKMVILSIVYIFGGLILFLRKKFEIVGTSFRSEKVHIFVRTLTTIPIVCIAYMIIRNFSISSYDIFAILLLIVLIFTYLIIYDLITRKKVTNFFKMAICLVVVFVLVVVCYSFFDDDYSIDAKDIKEISFLDANGMVIGSTKNTTVINNSISLLLDTASLDDYSYGYNIKTKIKGKMYSFSIYTTEDNYDYINNILINDKDFIKGLNGYKNSNVFGIKYIDGYTSTNDSNLADLIVNKYKKNDFVFVNDNIGGDDLFNVTLYMYDDFNVRSVTINVADDKELSLGILRYYNSNAKKFISSDDIYSYYVNGYNYGDDYDAVGKFIAEHIDDDLDINKEYGYIVLYGSYGKCVFATNDISGLNSLVDMDNNDNNDNDL